MGEDGWRVELQSNQSVSRRLQIEEREGNIIYLGMSDQLGVQRNRVVNGRKNQQVEGITTVKLESTESDDLGLGDGNC